MSKIANIKKKNFTKGNVPILTIFDSGDWIYISHYNLVSNHALATGLKSDSLPNGLSKLGGRGFW